MLKWRDEYEIYIKKYIYIYKIYEYEMYIMKYDQNEYKSPIVTIVYPHHNLNSWTGYYVHESICNWNENVKCIL